jgi:hypothetical protein
VVVRILVLVVGIVAVMIGAELPWGEVDLGEITIPLTFFLDIARIGAIVGVIGGAIGLLGLTDRVSSRSAGVALAIFGAAVAAGSAALMSVIDQNHLELDPVLAQRLTVSSVDLGPGGFVVGAGGLIIAVAGLLFMMAPSPPDPPLPASGGPGPVAAGWYALGPRSGQMAYWNGTRWGSQRRIPPPPMPPPAPGGAPPGY